jgi:uncharacterized membrane protein YfcA
MEAGMAPSLIFAVAAVVLATSFLSGVVGMAGGMILMGVLLAFLSVPSAMVLHGITQAASNGWRAFLWRAYVDWTILARYALGSLVALVLFALVQFVPNRALVLIALGLMPFAAMAVPARMAPRADRPLGSEISGFVSTALQLVSGVSGPALDIFFVRTELDRRRVVATKAVCQVSTHLLKLVYFGTMVSANLAEVGWPVMAISVVLALTGTTLSRTLLERLTDVQFRAWTQRIVMGVGLVYLVQGLAAYANG